MASNDDDRRQRRKQGGVVGAAASKTQVPPKAQCGCWVPQPVRSGSHFQSSYNKKELPLGCGSSLKHILRGMGRRLCVENCGHGVITCTC